MAGAYPARRRPIPAWRADRRVANCRVANCDETEGTAMTADPADRRARDERDRASRFEDAGIPDLQDGTLEQQWSEDPQELPLPGDRPNASVDWGTTVEEQVEGEPHGHRLARERPDPALEEISDVDGETDDVRSDEDGAVGRLRNDQAVEPGDLQPDTEATDVGADTGGLTAEERAVHVEPD
jgi:hypothetical protein